MVVTFDAGQTLIELDLDFLAVRLAERGVRVAPAALVAAEPVAWRHFDGLDTPDHGHAWRELFGKLLSGAGVSDHEAHVRWLYEQNRQVNVFRRSIPAMVELAHELAARGVIVAVVSNSEGGLAELLATIGLAGSFAAIVDSTRVGFEKPDRRIFEHALAAVGAPGATAIHIGDSWDADIVGARNAGWRAIWYGRRARPVDDPDVAIAHDAAETRAALVRWGVL